MFIDPNKTPLIDKNDARWLGAWWFGWIILGSAMLLFSSFIGMFPKQLPKRNKYRSEIIDSNNGIEEASLPLSCKTEFGSVERYLAVDIVDSAKLKGIPHAI